MTSTDDRTRTGGRDVWLLAAVNLGALGALTTPAVAGLPVAVSDAVPADQRAAALATVLTLGALAAVVSNPVFGALSDRTRGRLGRRRPWLLGGVLAGLVAIGGLTASDTLPAIALWWVLVQIAYNATLAAAAALLADTVPEPRRGAASGLFTAGAFVGALPPLLLATLLPHHLNAVSFVMPVVAVLIVLAALRVPDAAASTHPGADRRPSPLAGRRSFPRAFAAVWVQRFAMQSAFSLTTAFTLYLIADRMTGDAATATPVATLATLIGGAGVVTGAVVGGAWASRRGRYLPFLVVGALGLATAGLIRASATAPIMLWGAAMIGGTAVGCFLAVNLALALRSLPPERAGSYLGVLNVAETLPAVIAPAVATALLRVGSGDPLSGAPDDYVALYTTAALVALLSLAALPALRRVARSA
ncbi:MFS transporter [Microbacterium sp. NPDC089189]|uniref:MFS transporter n=1 Tax=Microbacterium sp. NPDC089189 TaxID=3154972 RepID=UPI00341B4BA4